MTEKQLKKLFTTASDNSTAGTKGEQGVGLGLLLSYEFAKANKGNIVVESAVGKGSTFTLQLPATKN
jgi:signal transduction histidine kinase